MSRSLGGRVFTIRSPIWIVPRVMSSSPAIIRRAVDFPHPDGPTRTMNSPSGISRLRSCTAWTPWANILSTRSSMIWAIILSPQVPVHHVHDWVENSPVHRGGWVTFCCPSRKREVRCGCSGWSCRARRRSRGRCLAMIRSRSEPVERFLAYLASVEKSPNTVKAYAHDLKDWFTYLAGHGVTGERRRWRTSPGSWRGCGCRREARDGKVAVLPTVERSLLGGQCEPQARGPDLVLRVPRPARSGAGRAAGHDAARGPSRDRRRRSSRSCTTSTKSEPQRRRAIKLKASRRRGRRC